MGNSSDRLIVAMVVALMIHAGLIMGVRFQMPAPPEIDRTLEVELVEQPNEKKPLKADYQAQANSGGSRVRQEVFKPHAALTRLRRATLKAEGAKRDRHAPKRLTQAQASASLPAIAQAKPAAEPHLDRNLLAQQIAELNGMAFAVQAHSKERAVPIQQINAYKHIAAAYERAWQEKVERVGNLNYPDEARRQGLSGALVVSVWVAKDGQVKKIKIHRSSGHPVLDEAALRIVRLAAPFSSFPVELANQADEIVITRTWKFYDEAGLAMGR
ncbi:MAG: TonB family protein [Methylohalobius sp.]